MSASMHSIGTRNARGMRLLFARNGVGALRLAPAKGEILARSFVERDHQVVGRHLGGRCDTGVDVFQECEPRFLASGMGSTSFAMGWQWCRCENSRSSRRASKVGVEPGESSFAAP